MTEVELRRYNHETDYPGLRNLLEEAGLFDPDYEAPDRLAVASHKYPDMITVAIRNDEIIGSVYLQDGVVPQVNRLAVRNEEQGQGVGAQLLSSAELRARELGHKYLELFVSPENVAALSFYKKHGYASGQTYLNMYRNLDA